MPEIGPSLILATIVGIMNVALYVLIRGTARARLMFLVPAAILGVRRPGARCTAGASVAHPRTSVSSASIMAWIGIVIVVIIGTLVPSREDRDQSANPEGQLPSDALRPVPTTRARFADGRGPAVAARAGRRPGVGADVRPVAGLGLRRGDRVVDRPRPRAPGPALHGRRRHPGVRPPGGGQRGHRRHHRRAVCTSAPTPGPTRTPGPAPPSRSAWRQSASCS